ncbi:MAG: cell division protein SepF [Ruminococcaceae bacterium]|nr:cell division protein SepF [Oscillospiraceae bacterium]
MAALFDKVKGFLGMDESEIVDYDNEGLYDFDDEVEDTAQTNRFIRSTSKKSDFEVSSTSAKGGRLFGNRFSSGIDFKQTEAKKESKENTKEEARKMVNVGSSGMRLVLCKPTEFDNCQGICSHLRAQMTIVLNLQYVANAADRKRIFDFVSGCCYALDGNIQKVADLIYVVAPCSVDVFAEVAEGEKVSSEAYDYDNIF